MNTWFARANGKTGHNNPASSLYVAGEPPNYPKTEFRYTRVCLEDGFARVGWPGTGDLRKLGWEQTAEKTYGTLMQPRYYKHLRDFVRVRAGDVFVMPADRGRYDVHVGRVVPPRHLERAGSSESAYYYYYDVSAGDWFENAHRVDVDWLRDPSGVFAVVTLRELGGLWRRFFGPIRTGHERLLVIARDAGLLS